MHTSNIQKINLLQQISVEKKIPFKLPFSSKSLLAMCLLPEVSIGGKEDLAVSSSRPKEYIMNRYAIPKEKNITTGLPVLP